MLDPARMRRLAIVLIGGVALASAALACGAERLPGPAYVGQPTAALVEVPYPPPPARAEYVPRSPNERAVWIDGEWIWQGQRYGWKPGRWVIPPDDGALSHGAAYAPWTTVRNSAGTLYLAGGTWRDRSGREIPPPQQLRIGTTRPGAITDPEGDTFPPGQIVDAGLLPPPDAMQLPDGTLEPVDSAILPEAAGFETIDARMDPP